MGHFPLIRRQRNTTAPGPANSEQDGCGDSAGVLSSGGCSSGSSPPGPLRRGQLRARDCLGTELKRLQSAQSSSRRTSQQISASGSLPGILSPRPGGTTEERGVPVPMVAVSSCLLWRTHPHQLPSPPGSPQSLIAPTPQQQSPRQLCSRERNWTQRRFAFNLRMGVLSTERDSYQTAGDPAAFSTGRLRNNNQDYAPLYMLHTFIQCNLSTARVGPGAACGTLVSRAPSYIYGK